MKFINGIDPLDSAANRQMAARLASQWKLTPATFAHEISRHQWIPSKHLMYISSRVAKGIARGNARIIISAPPRHGKSQLTSIYTPAWVLENFPHYKTIITGYGADLVTGFSRQVRDLFTDQSNFGLLNTRIRKDASRVEQFLTDQGGGVFAVGLGGAITGRGAHVLLIDDYIKEIKEALSPAYRDYIWNWFVTTAFTRLEPGGSCIIIATRWHSDDLIGRILKNLPEEGWEYIEIPAIAEENDIIGRAVGEALFPERYPLKRLKELQVTLGSVFFKALFQQKPVDESKKITDRNWIQIIPEIDWIARKTHSWKRTRMWDFAATKDGGDYTTGTLLAYDITTGNVYVENVIRRQMSPGQVETCVAQTAAADGYDVAVRIEQEPGSSGKALVHHFATNVLKNYKVIPVPVVTNKIARAQPFIAAAEAGKIYCILGGWNESFLKEFDEFPGSAHDDQVDTASAGYTELTGKVVYTAAWGRSGASGSTRNSHAIEQASRENVVSFSTGRVTGATFGR